MSVQTGKARRLKQAKEEAQQEIEVYRQECEKQYREHEAKVVKSLCLDILLHISILFQNTVPFFGNNIELTVGL